MNYTKEKRICKLGLWDDTMPGISFDIDGISNFCHLQQKMMSDYPRGEKGKNDWMLLVKKIRQRGKRKQYDCLIGVSGGVDSSFLLHIAKEYGLRPLAVHLDNGFNSEIAVSNIEKVTKELGVDLVTHVINYEEIKDLFKSYMKASLPWIDAPTDLAIKALMYKIARKENIKYILRGNDFRSEGKQPTDWTYSDVKQLKYVHGKFGSGIKLRTYPTLSLIKIIISGLVNKIRDIRPYYYIDYNKNDAKKILINRYGWQYYGGHHHENIFTKFAMSYWLPEKFNIDKRKINLSAQILSGSISRSEGIEELTKPFDTKENIKMTNEYVCKKLNFSEKEFVDVLKSSNKFYKDYPSNYNLIYKNIKHFKWLIKSLYGFKPMSIDSNEMIK